MKEVNQIREKVQKMTFEEAERRLCVVADNSHYGFTTEDALEVHFLCQWMDTLSRNTDKQG